MKEMYGTSRESVKWTKKWSGWFGTMEAQQGESCTGRGRPEWSWEVKKAGDYTASQLGSEGCAYIKSSK